MSGNYILENEIERYCNRITSKIFSKERRQDIKAEYKDYIRESVCSLIADGKSEKEAFELTIAELGDETKLTELLRHANNSNNLKRFFAFSIAIVMFIAFFTSYFWIENTSYRSYYVLIIQLALLVLSVYLLLVLIRFLRAINIRRKTLIKLKKNAKENNYNFFINSNSFTSLFFRKDSPEWIFETEKTRYIIYLWSTIKSKKTLRLSSNGLYSYSNNIGYMNLLTNPRGHILTGGAVFCPSNINYYEKFPNMHSNMVEVKKGWDLMPKIFWEHFESSTKNNINVFLLNPVPYSFLCIENGIEKKVPDGYTFCGFSVWSAEGFLSFVKGEKLLGES